MGRFGILLYDDDDDLGDSSSPGEALSVLRLRPPSSDGKGGGGGSGDATESTNEDLEYSDDESDRGVSSSSDDDDEEDEDEDDEPEPPHPLGFSESWRGNRGRRRLRPAGKPSSRYAVDWGRHPPKETVEAYKKRMGYAYPFQVHESLLSPEFMASPPKQQFPPLESYLDPRTASTRDLVQAVESLTPRDDDTHFDASAAIRQHEIQEIVDLFAASALAVGDDVRAIGSSVAAAPVPVPDPLAHLSVESQTEPYRAMLTDQRRVQAEVESFRGPILKEHKERKLRLLQILKEQENAARRAQLEIEQQRRDEEQAEMQKQVEEQERLEREQEEADAAQRAEDDAERERMQKEARERQAAEEEARAAQEEAARADEEPEHVTRAHKLVRELVLVRASVEPFEASNDAAVKRRRLQMKKLVAGKVNTLTESAEKIRSVAAEVAQAIAAARSEDERLKQQLSARTPGVSPEMARGKRYLIDLLASKVIVRVQAEGFNGTRGDGFPLANMLALVSLDCKELAPILTAHIYTACPTAIPSLPRPAANASEEELMESLGMLRKDDGTFETFERFLHRTESIISLVADIMASNPPRHKLLGGNEAAIRWLSAFLEFLPEVPEAPLPLLTAPVLDAFLTGAGHMLANVHPVAFQLHLVFIINDILPRLDEGSIGAPSATRLKKTIGEGLEWFKSNLPSKAIPELYYGANESASHVESAVASTLSTTQQPQANNPFQPPAASDPFRPSTATASSPFSAAFRPSSSAPLSFGGATVIGSNATSQSPFSSAPSPFNSSSVATLQPFGSATAAFPLSYTSSSTTMMDSGMDADSIASSAVSTALPFRQSGGLGFTSSGAPSFAASTMSFGSSSSAPSLAASTNTSSSSASSGTMSFGAPSFGSSGTLSFGTSSSAPSFAASSQSAVAGSTAPSPSPFLQPPSTLLGAAPSHAPSPFGAFGTAAPTQSLFQAPLAAPSIFGVPSASAQNATPFGSAPSNPSPFGLTQNQSPFSSAFSSASFGQPAFAGSTPAPSSTGFSVSTTTSSSTLTSTSSSSNSAMSFGSALSNPSPFGASSSTPFGVAPSPFGQTGMTGLGTSPFGQPPATPFGQASGALFGAPATTTSGYGGTKGVPCRFFAQGYCRFGSNCKFSHDSPAAQNYNTPFGGPRR